MEQTGLMHRRQCSMRSMPSDRFLRAQWPARDDLIERPALDELAPDADLSVDGFAPDGEHIRWRTRARGLLMASEVGEGAG
jgi:hypothetical protein